MARQTRTRSPRTSSAEKNPGTEAATLPYNLRRELEEITKNSGMVIDYTLPINELEDICNKANSPQSSWRNRWAE